MIDMQSALIRKFMLMLVAIIAAMGALFLSACSGGTTASSSTNTSAANIAVATFSGAIFQDSTLLPGSGALAVPNEGSLSVLITNSSGDVFTISGGGVYTPYNNAWSFVNQALPGGFEATALAVSSDNILFAGTDNGNVYESVSGSWVLLDESLPVAVSISALAVDSTNHVFAATSAGQVYKSANGQWELVNSAAPDGSGINSLAIDANDNLYSATESGAVYESIAGSWVAVNIAPVESNGAPAISLAIAPNGSLFVATARTDFSAGSVYESIAGNWVLVNNVAAGTFIYNIAIGASGNLYAAVDTGIIESLNGAWSLVGGDFADYAQPWSVAVFATDTVYGGSKTGSMFVSENNAAWQGVVSGAVADGAYALSVGVNSAGAIFTAVFSSAGGGVYQWNGSTWQVVNQLLSGPVYSMQISGTTIYIGGDEGKVYESIAGSWVMVNAPTTDTSSINILQQNQGNLFAATGSGNVYESIGGSWVQLNGAAIPGEGIDGMSVSVTGQVFVNNEMAVYESVNGNWQEVNESIPNQFFLVIATDNAGHLYAGGGAYDSGSASYSGNVYESVAGQWVMLNNESMPDSGIVSALTIDSNNNVYAATIYGNVYESVAGAWLLLYSYSYMVSSMAIMPN